MLNAYNSWHVLFKQIAWDEVSSPKLYTSIYFDIIPRKTNLSKARDLWDACGNTMRHVAKLSVLAAFGKTDKYVGASVMDRVLAIGFFAIIFYYLIQFARQENIQEYYEDAIIDVEGRLDWARTRTFFPFGMKAQMQVSSELLGKAKSLWKGNKWQQAYRVASQAQEAMNKAQNIYSSAIKDRY